MALNAKLTSHASVLEHGPVMSTRASSSNSCSYPSKSSLGCQILKTTLVNKGVDLYDPGSLASTCALSSIRFYAQHVTHLCPSCWLMPLLKVLFRSLSEVNIGPRSPDEVGRS